MRPNRKQLIVLAVAVLVGLAVTAVVFCLFASLAWKVILEDYVPGPSRSALILVSNLVFLVLAAASVFFIVRLALGSAPLPAGV